MSAVLVLLLFVAACSSDSGLDGSQLEANAEPTAQPDDLDLEGGATSDESGVTVNEDSPRDALRPDAADISGQWNTDWSRTTIDLSELAAGLGGSDPRDGIPPIDNPVFEAPAEAAEWLDENEPGALVQLDGEARFYPLSIMTRHEIVNDRMGDIPVAVTYCPLCNTAIAFDARVDGQALRFGVSGLLRQSDLVMWDSATDSLWQQITGEAIVGEFAGTELELISTAIVSFGDFAEQFPDGQSLSRDTGFGIPYGSNPYVGYSSSPGPIGGFFQGDVDPRLPALERVVSVSIHDADVAYPFSVIAEEQVVNDTVGDTPVAVFWGGATTDALDASTIAESQQVGTGIAYDATVDGQVLTFSANGDDTFTDAETGSTWSLLGLATDGDLAGTQLVTAPHRNEFWFAFASFFPDATVYGLE